MPSRYTFCDYDPAWPAQFEQEAARLRALLGGELLAVHHIGSTSVPGLAAKPTIDLLPVVRSIVHIDELTPMLVAAGYKAWGEYGLPGRRLFTRDCDGYRTHNIHMYEPGHLDVERHVAFATYLRTHPEVAVEYAALKRSVYARFPADISGYNNGKNDWIKRLEPVAIAWYRTQQPRTDVTM